jgi:hypothetical protein
MAARRRSALVTLRAERTNQQYPSRACAPSTCGGRWAYMSRLRLLRMPRRCPPMVSGRSALLQQGHRCYSRSNCELRTVRQRSDESPPRISLRPQCRDMRTHLCSATSLGDTTNCSEPSTLLLYWWQTGSGGTFQLHLVEGPAQGIEWSRRSWLQYKPGRTAFHHA